MTHSPAPVAFEAIQPGRLQSLKDMQRLSLCYFYDMGAALRPIKDLQAGPTISSVWTDLYRAEVTIDGFHANSWFWGSIRSSYSLGRAVVSALITLRTDPDLSRAITYADIFSISSAISAYEPVLRAELSTADAYFVTPKGGYDTLALITNAPVLFPQSLSEKVPDCLPEIREAGKCLAFELCTAAGIHVLRAMEIVLKAYYKAVTKGAALPSNRNLGAYLKKMNDLGVGDAKVLAVLTQIKDLHRNSLMHPDETLDKDGAIGLFGIVQSAIAAMLNRIPNAPAVNAVAALGGP